MLDDNGIVGFLTAAHLNNDVAWGSRTATYMVGKSYGPGRVPDMLFLRELHHRG